MTDRSPRPPGACIYGTSSYENVPVWKARLPIAYAGPCARVAQRIEDLRRDALRRRDEMLGLQKWCGVNKDRDGARFFKDEAADAMKEYRAACLVLPMFVAEPPGDCPVRREWEWPVELAPWIDRVVWRLVA